MSKIKKKKNILNEKKHKLTYENEKNRLKNNRRRIFYRIQTSADNKKHQKASADENLTN